jgi:hypothetical protein
MCEVQSGRCIDDPGLECTYQPDFDDFAPDVQVAWRDGPDTPAPDYNQVMMTPAVADLNSDGVPEVVFSTFTGSAYNQESVLRAFDGRTRVPLFDLVDSERRVSGSGSLAVGDIDADGRVELVAVRPDGDGLVAFDDVQTDWAVLWIAAGFSMAWDGAAIADLDRDGRVEVVAANRVLSGADGTVHCVAELSSSPRNSVPVDLDGDSRLEVVSHGGAFRFDGDAALGYTCPVAWNAPDGGFTAVGDFGTFEAAERHFGLLDGLPEVVFVTGGAEDNFRLVNGTTGEVIWSVSFPLAGHPHFTEEQCANKTGGGPPTVADFDGDGAPEAASAGACYYLVVDTDGTPLWKHPSQDFSSRVTGSSVFDFEGDGKAEAVYADECFIRVYDGAGNGDGTTEVLFQRAHSSGTTRELPVIVDVDADHHAEIVLISNDYSSGTATRCRDTWPDYDALGGDERGVLIIEDSRNEWVSTRPIWNQHAYYVTNVCGGMDDDICPGRQNLPGAIPIGEVSNAATPWLNSFRQNVQGEGLFDAPDLVVVALEASCDLDGLSIEVTVGNQGSRGVLAGVPVGVWIGDVYLGALQTTRDLLPGARETLRALLTSLPGDARLLPATVRVVVDGDESGPGTNHECDEDNNEATVVVICPEDPA